MSEQRIDALIATIDDGLRQIAALKAERTELREALEMLMNWIGPPPTGPQDFDSLRESGWNKARAVLAKGKPI